MSIGSGAGVAAGNDLDARSPASWAEMVETLAEELIPAEVSEEQP